MTLHPTMPSLPRVPLATLALVVAALLALVLAVPSGLVYLVARRLQRPRLEPGSLVLETVTPARVVAACDALGVLPSNLDRLTSADVSGLPLPRVDAFLDVVGAVLRDRDGARVAFVASSPSSRRQMAALVFDPWRDALGAERFVDRPIEAAAVAALLRPEN